MSKSEKRLAQLFSHPPPKDFRWEDLVTIMSAHDFKHECQGGSHFTFEHSSGLVFQMSRSHPDGILKAYQVKKAKEVLIAIGY